MGVRSIGYDNENLDGIFCYFMRTILRLQNSGIENLPLENNFEEPFKTFLDIAIEMIIDGQPPELSRLILDSEYDAIISRGQRNVETTLGLQMIKELSLHIHYDEDYYGYLLATGNLWGNAALAYASLTFYPNLPEAIKEKYQIYDLIKRIPQEMFRLEDY